MRGSEDGPSRAPVRGRLGLLPVVVGVALVALLAGCVFVDGPTDPDVLPDANRPPMGMYRSGDGRFFALGYPCTDWMVKEFVLSTAPPVVLPEETVILEVVFDVPVSVREVAIDLSVDAVQPGAVRTVYDPETLHRFNADPSFLSFDDDLWPFVSFVNPAGESDGWAGAWTQRFEIPPGVVSTLEGDYQLDAVCPDGTRGWTVDLP